MKKLLIPVTMGLLALTLQSTPIKLENSKLQPVAYARLAPLSKTIVKVSETLQAIKPGPQTAMMAGSIGLMLGDPGFTSFDPDANVNFYAFNNFNDDDPPDFIILLKIAPDSAAEKSILKMGDVQISRQKGWTILTPKKSKNLLDKIGNLTPLIKHANEKAKADIEIGLFTQTLLEVPFLSEKMKEGISELQKVEDEESIAKNGAALAELALSEIRTIEEGNLRISLGEKAINLELAMHAKPDSALGQLLSSRSGGKVPEASLIQAKGMFHGTYSYDSKAVLAYWNSLVKRARKNTDGKVDKLIEEVDKMMQESMPLYAGTGAVSMDMSQANPDAQIHLESVNATTSTDAQLIAYLKSMSSYSDTLIQTITQTFGSVLGDLSGDISFEEMIDYEITVKENDFKVDGIPVHTMNQKVDIEGEDSDWESYYYAITNGQMLAATSKDSISRLVKGSKTGAKAKNAVSSILPNGTLMKGSFNPKMYVGIIFGGLSAAFSDKDDENPLAKKLEKLEVEPWILAATLGDNRSATSLTINHKSVRTLVEFSEEVAKEMMKDFGPSDDNFIDLDEPKIDLSKIEIPMDLEIEQSNGNKTTLAALTKGKKAVMLDFWATWCGPCMALMPELKKKAKKLGPQGIVVAGMNVERGLKKAERTRKKLEIDFAWLVEPKGEPLSGPLEIDSIPRMVLISPEGKVLFNGHPQDAGLAEALAEIGVEL